MLASGEVDVSMLVSEVSSLESLPGVLLVTTVFGVVTVLTMLAAVWLTLVGLDRLRLPAFERYAHALAGGAVLTCGLAIAFLGL